jgi:hypothetical protein
MSVLLGFGCAGPSIVSKAASGIRLVSHHHPSNGHAAGVFVSHLFHGAARHRHRVRLAWQVVMGFFLLHGRSLAAAAGALYGESFSEVDIWN